MLFCGKFLILIMKNCLFVFQNFGFEMTGIFCGDHWVLKLPKDA